MEEKSHCEQQKPHKPIAKYDGNVDDLIFIPAGISVESSKRLSIKKPNAVPVAVSVKSDVDDSDSQLSIPRNHPIPVKSRYRSRSGREKPQRSYTKVNRCRCDCCVFWRSAIKKESNPSYEFIYRNLIDHYLTRNEFYLDDEISKVHEKSLFNLMDKNVSKFHSDTVVLDYSELSVTFTEKIEQLYLHECVQKCLKKMGIHSMRPVQYYVWPVMLRNQNVVLVGDPDSGKSFSYIPPILSLICNEFEIYDEDDKNQSTNHRIQPWAIIMCSNSRAVFQLHKYFSTFQVPNLHFSCLLSPLMIHDFLKCPNQHPQLIIGTPEGFQEALEMQLIDFQMLIVCVFDTWNSYASHQMQICDEILKDVKEQLMKVEKENPLLVVVSEMWTENLKYFADEHFHDAVYCIQSNIEASIYAGHSLRLSIIEDTKKVHFVTEIIKKIGDNEKILVVSNSVDELLELSEFFINFGISFDLLTKTLTKEEIYDIKANWNSTLDSKVVLLCTDEVLRLTYITNATVLINLSIPDLWSTFKFRFSTLSHNTTIRKLKSVKKCQIHIIIVDGESLRSMYSLSNLLSRLDLVDEDFREFCDSNCETVEKLKANSGYHLCSTLLSYGQCFNQTYHNACKRSHRFLQNDNILDLPDNGILKFRIVKIPSPTRFFVQLLEVIDADSTIDFVRTNYDQVQQCLEDLKYKFDFDRSSIRYVDIYDIVSIGQLYGYAMHNNRMVARAKIIAIGYRLVDIFLIDTGHELYNVPIDDLFHLPESLKKLPSSTIEVYLANLVPKHLPTEKSFCLHCTHTVISNLGKYSFLGHHYCGRILFRYQSVYWLDDLYLYEDKGGQILSLKEYLVENQIAYVDDTILDTVKKIIVESVQGSSRPFRHSIDENVDVDVVNNTATVIEQELVEPKSLVEPYQTKELKIRWAKLPDNMFSKVRVAVTQINDINDFFIVLRSKTKVIEQLENEIRLNELDMVSDGVQVNKFYAALLPDGAVKRAYVLSIQFNVAECFLLDSGSIQYLDLDCIRILKREYIEKLAFQAIKCRFWGVEKKIYRNSTFIFQKILEMKPFSVYNYETAAVINEDDEPHIELDQQYYGVLLITKSVTVNRWLIDEFPNDYQMNANEEFMDFLDNTDSDISESSCLSMTESEHFKTIDNNKIPNLNNNFNNLAFVTIKKENDEPIVPTVYWSQTRDSVVARIQVIDAVGYQIDVNRKQLFTFSCGTKSDPNKFFGFRIYLNRKVNDNFVKRIGKTEIKVIFSKLIVGTHWSNFTFDDNEYHWVHSDVENGKKIGDLDSQNFDKSYDSGDNEKGSGSSVTDLNPVNNEINGGVKEEILGGIVPEEFSDLDDIDSVFSDESE